MRKRAVAQEEKSSRLSGTYLLLLSVPLLTCLLVIQDLVATMAL